MIHMHVGIFTQDMYVLLAFNGISVDTGNSQVSSNKDSFVSLMGPCYHGDIRAPCLNITY